MANEYLHRLFLLFANILEYPSILLKQKVFACAGLLYEACPPAGEMFSGFQRWVREEPIAHMEEIYTSTFDLQGVCCPYVGHYLFGDNYQRSWFMAHLNASYREKGFIVGNELPDHITVILRFLARGDQDEFSRVLLEEGLAPSLEKMVQVFVKEGNHPYGQVLKSLLLLLQDMNSVSLAGSVSSEKGGLVND